MHVPLYERLLTPVAEFDQLLISRGVVEDVLVKDWAETGQPIVALPIPYGCRTRRTGDFIVRHLLADPLKMEEHRAVPLGCWID